MAKHGSEEIPHNYFKILKRNHYSEDLGIGFIHQVLRFQMDIDGPTEIGGLLVERHYRRRPENLENKLVFQDLYIGLHPDQFEDRVLWFSPHPWEDGRSEFWEALGEDLLACPIKRPTY